MSLQDEVASKLNQWTAENKAEAEKGPAAMKADKTKQLYTDYLIAKETKENAPADYTQAVNAYLISRDGPEGVFEAYRRKATTMNNERLIKFRTVVQQTVGMVQNYKTMYTAALRSQDAYLKQLDEYAAQIDEANLLHNEKTTAQRKSYYLHQVNDTTETRDGLLTVYIVALAVVYAKQFIAPNPKNPLMWGGLALLLLSSYLLPRLIGVVMNIQPTMNVYTTWVQPNPIWTGSTLKYEPGQKSGIVVS